MAIHDEAALILQLCDLRREETMRTARNWYAREFNPESMADIEKAFFGEHSAHRMGAAGHTPPGERGRPQLRCHLHRIATGRGDRHAAGYDRCSGDGDFA